MKSVAYGEDIRAVPEYLTLAEEATARLEKILGRSAPDVSAEWRQEKDDRGRNLLALRIWDGSDEARTRLVPDEMKYPGHTKFQMARLWGKLLDSRLDRQMQRLLDNGSPNGE